MQKVIAWVMFDGRLVPVLCDDIQEQNGTFVLFNPQITFDLLDKGYKAVEWTMSAAQVSSYARVMAPSEDPPGDAALRVE